MKDIPLISIALCTYNGQKFLREQLDSLVYQDYPNLEIVVTDDCSSDQTPVILKEYSNRFPFVRVYYNEKNLGYIKNFEKAIERCKGELIALSDQDDVWQRDKISKMKSFIGDNLLAYHDSAFINDEGESMNKKMSDILNMYSGNSFKPFLFFNCVSGHACLFKRSLVSSSLPFPKEIAHDHWLAFAALNLGTIGYLDLPLVNYRQHENSDTNILRLERNKIEARIEGRQKIEKTITELERMLLFRLNKNKAFIEKLIYLYLHRLRAYLCLPLVIFMFNNYKSLLFISKKSTLSKLNFAFKHLWGGKLKKID